MPAKAYLPQPKPRAHLADRMAAKRERDRLAAAFRLAVWLRDAGICRACSRKVRRTIELVPERGEIHHRRGRRVAPEDLYNPDRAVLLCHLCHIDPAVIQRFRPVRGWDGYRPLVEA